MNNAPCKGNSNIPLFFLELPLQGALFGFVSVYPGRCPGLWKHWAFSPLCMSFDTHSMRHLRTARPEGATLHSPGQRPGYETFTNNAPYKGNSNIPLFFLELPLQGALFGFVSVYPGRCPGLWKHWAFSPLCMSFDSLLWRTLGFQPALRKRYWCRVLANVIGLTSLLIRKHILLVIFNIIQFQKLSVFILE